MTNASTCATAPYSSAGTSWPISHAACEIGQEVPAELYGAVAQVLAFVMSLRSRGAAAGLHRPPSLTNRRP
jgi:hypothetical protein